MPLYDRTARLGANGRAPVWALAAAGAILFSGLLSAPSNLRAATPAPLPRPFPAPVTTRTVSVPGSIDSTGRQDASPALQVFLESVPDGSRILFKAEGIYRLERGLLVANRHHLEFDGRGATLRARGPSNLVASSAFLLDGANSDIAIRNFIIDGANARTGVDLFDPNEEDPQGIAIYGGSRIEIASNTIRNTLGDGIYANEKDTTHSWVEGLWIHDNSLIRIGRMGVTFNGVSNGTVERNQLDKIGMFAFDIEPNTSSQGARNVAFLDNVVGAYGLTPLYTTWFFAAANNDVAAGAVIDGVTISGNRVTVGAPSSRNTPNAGGLATWIGRSRVKNVTFTNNQTTKPGFGPVLVFEHVDGLTVIGNVQPVIVGSVTRISDSTAVIMEERNPVSDVAILALSLLVLGGGRLIARRQRWHALASPDSEEGGPTREEQFTALDRG
jgi:hypothetical protein